ncbi:hypothetical protein [Evansella clarkii]|uniref:hypothetical protein n=1 Tax=Evansella clarkii TaxID=79879 RepID=UPI000998E23E|nr:hypothetical protein [Evansella clarkii]
MRGNKIVLFVPLTVMIGLFIMGYMTLNQAEQVTNEELLNFVQLAAETENNNGETELRVNWQWGDFPSDGLRGAGFIEITPVDDAGEPVDFEIMDSRLLLTQSAEIIYERDQFEQGDEGIFVQFPNRADENIYYGPLGEVTITFSDFSSTAEYIEVSYYHTWEDSDITGQKGVSVRDILNEGSGKYWELQRLERLP